MSTDNHTAIAFGAALDAATFNPPLGELDAAIGDVASWTGAGSPSSAVEIAEQLLVEIGDSSALDVADGAGGSAANLVEAVNVLQVILGLTTQAQRLKEWVSAGAYEMTAITYHATYKGVIASATLVWPDGSAGTYTNTSTNTTHVVVDAFTASHTDSGLTVTQAAVTRDIFGNVTVKPALTVA